VCLPSACLECGHLLAPHAAAAVSQQSLACGLCQFKASASSEPLPQVRCCRSAGRAPARRGRGRRARRRPHSAARRAARRIRPGCPPAGGPCASAHSSQVYLPARRPYMRAHMAARVARLPEDPARAHGSKRWRQAPPMQSAQDLRSRSGQSSIAGTRWLDCSALSQRPAESSVLPAARGQ